MQDIHQIINDTEDSERDRTYKKGRNQINAIFATETVLQYVSSSKIIDFDEIIPTDNRGFLININFEEYFNVKPSKYNKSESRKLNPNNRRHKRSSKKS